jgi:hypothetical protein
VIVLILVVVLVIILLRLFWLWDSYDFFVLFFYYVMTKQLIKLCGFSKCEFENNCIVHFSFMNINHFVLNFLLINKRKFFSEKLNSTNYKYILLCRLFFLWSLWGNWFLTKNEKYIKCLSILVVIFWWKCSMIIKKIDQIRNWFQWKDFSFLECCEERKNVFEG